MNEAIRLRLLMAATRLAAKWEPWPSLLDGTKPIPENEQAYRFFSEELQKESGLPEWDLADLMTVLEVTRRQAALN
jgi:hypothetical protein